MKKYTIEIESVANFNVEIVGRVTIEATDDHWARKIAKSMFPDRRVSARPVTESPTHKGKSL